MQIAVQDDKTSKITGVIVPCFELHHRKSHSLNFHWKSPDGLVHGLLLLLHTSLRTLKKTNNNVRHGLTLTGESAI